MCLVMVRSPISIKYLTQRVDEQNGAEKSGQGKYSWDLGSSMARLNPPGRRPSLVSHGH